MPSAVIDIDGLLGSLESSQLICGMRESQNRENDSTIQGHNRTR